MSESLEITLHNRQQAWAAIKAQVFPFLSVVLQAGGRWVLTIKRMTRTTAQNRRYCTSNVVKYKHRNTLAVGCESPLARGMSRNTARHAAFSISATNFGGSDGMASAMSVTLRVPRPLTPIRAAAPCESGTAVVNQAQLEQLMPTEEVAKKTRVRRQRTEAEKIKASEQNAARYAANREKIKKQVADYRAANQDKVKASQSKYLAANKEAIAKKHKAYAAKNSEKKKQAAAEWRRLNPERAKAAVDAWYAKNPDAMKIKKHTRRARLLAGGKLSSDIVLKLLKLQRGMCAACHCKLSKSGQHIDHIMPIAKGGANTDDNVQLLCPPCNLAKNAKHPIDWAQENGRLL